MKRLRKPMAMFMAFFMALSSVNLTAFASDDAGHEHNQDGWECTWVEPVTEPACVHEHTDDCYIDEEPALKCDITEHGHSPECYEAGEDVLTCEEEHEHGPECYESGEDVLACNLPEHEHGPECYEAGEQVLECKHVCGEECFRIVQEGYWDCKGPSDEDDTDIINDVVNNDETIQIDDMPVSNGFDTMSCAEYPFSSDSLFGQTLHIDANVVKEFDRTSLGLDRTMNAGDTYIDEGIFRFTDVNLPEAGVYEINSWDDFDIWSTNLNVLRVSAIMDGNSCKITYEAVSEGTATVMMGANMTTVSTGEDSIWGAGNLGGAVWANCIVGTITVKGLGVPSKDDIDYWSDKQVLGIRAACSADNIAHKKTLWPVTVATYPDSYCLGPVEENTGNNSDAYPYICVLTVNNEWWADKYSQGWKTTSGDIDYGTHYVDPKTGTLSTTFYYSPEESRWINLDSIPLTVWVTHENNKPDQITHTVTVNYLTDGAEPAVLKASDVVTIEDGDSFDYSMENGPDGNGTVIPKRLGDDSEYVLDEALSADALAELSAAHEVHSDIEVDIVYSLDVKGGDDPNVPEGGHDNVPDKYQAKVQYRALDGGTQDGIDVYETITDSGRMSEEGVINIAGATAVPDDGYTFMAWTTEAEGHDGWSYDCPDSESIPADVISAKGGAVYTFTASFEEDEKGPFIVTIHFQSGHYYPTVLKDPVIMTVDKGSSIDFIPPRQLGDNNQYAFDEPDNADSFEAMKNIQSDTDITFYYSYDVHGTIETDEYGMTTDTSDGIPDIYQVKVVFRVVGGSWNDGTNDDVIRYLTTYKSIDGQPVMHASGEAVLGDIIPDAGLYPDKNHLPNWCIWTESTPTPETTVKTSTVYVCSYHIDNSAYPGANKNKTIDFGDIVKYVGESGYVQRIPIIYQTCPSCKAPLRMFSPDADGYDMPGDIVYDESLLAIDTVVGEYEKSDNGPKFVGEPCCQFDFVALRPGTTKVESVLYYYFGVSSMSGNYVCGYCNYSINGFPGDYAIHYDDISFTAKVVTDYTVDYVGDGVIKASETIGTRIPSQFYKFTAADAPADREGYIFKGWSYSGDGKTYQPGDIIAMAWEESDSREVRETMTAVWEKEAEPTELDPNGVKLGLLITCDDDKSHADTGYRLKNTAGQQFCDVQVSEDGIHAAVTVPNAMQSTTCLGWNMQDGKTPWRDNHRLAKGTDLTAYFVWDGTEWTFDEERNAGNEDLKMSQTGWSYLVMHVAHPAAVNYKVVLEYYTGDKLDGFEETTGTGHVGDIIKTDSYVGFTSYKGKEYASTDSHTMTLTANAASNIMTVTFHRQPLDIVKSATEFVMVGETITYAIMVSNPSGMDFHNVVVDDILSRNVEYLSATLDGDSVDFSSGSCTLPNLEAGKSAVLEVKVKALAVGTVTNRAYVDSDETDPVGSNEVETEVLQSIRVVKETENQWLARQDIRYDVDSDRMQSSSSRSFHQMNMSIPAGYLYDYIRDGGVRVTYTAPEDGGLFGEGAVLLLYGTGLPSRRFKPSMQDGTLVWTVPKVPEGYRFRITVPYPAGTDVSHRAGLHIVPLAYPDVEVPAGTYASWFVTVYNDSDGPVTGLSLSDSCTMEGAGQDVVLIPDNGVSDVSDFSIAPHSSIGFWSYVVEPAAGHYVNTVQVVKDGEVLDEDVSELDVVGPVYTVNVRYVYGDGSEAASGVSKTGPVGTGYSFTSPGIEGFTPDRDVVSGEIDGNKTITVTYKSTMETFTVHFTKQFRFPEGDWDAGDIPDSFAVKYELQSINGNVLKSDIVTKDMFVVDEDTCTLSYDIVAKSVPKWPMDLVIEELDYDIEGLTHAGMESVGKAGSVDGAICTWRISSYTTETSVGLCNSYTADVVLNAEYTVTWYDMDGNILKGPEIRTGNAGDMVSVKESDKSYIGYMFDESDSRNILSDELAESGTELRLYFRKYHEHEYHTVTKPDCIHDGVERCSCGDERTISNSALGHDFGNVEWKDDHEGGHVDGCESKQHVRVCERCHGELAGGVQHQAHDYEAWTITRQPTVESEGLKERYCKACDHAQKELIPKMEHTVAIDKAVKPDCIHTGLTEGMHCLECGEVLVKQETVPALGHDFTDAAWSDGKGHTEGCTSTEHTRTCVRCHSELEGGSQSEAHSYSEWKTVKEPTETEDGLRTRHCLKCDHIESEPIDKLPVKPVEPDKPTEPQKPTEPEKPKDPAKPEEPVDVKKPDEPELFDIPDDDTPLANVPQTGDDIFYLFPAFLSGLGLILRRRRK